MRILKTFSVIFAAFAVIAFVATVVLRVLGADEEAPMISMDSEQISISVGDGEDRILAGVSAQDTKDGDVTGTLVVESLSNFISEGERTATIAAFDTDNHVSKITRIIRYTDYQSPHFALSAPLSFPQGTDDTLIASALSAQDCLDGNITQRIVYTNAEGSSLRTDMPGEYPMVFSVSNSAGDIERFTATVEIYDLREEGIPSITLTENMVYVTQGASFDPLTYIATVSLDGIVYQMQNGMLIRAGTAPDAEEIETYDLNSIALDNPVDVNTPGWYEVGYSVTSMVGVTRTAHLLVCVEA